MANMTIEKTEEINRNKSLPQGWVECELGDITFPRRERINPSNDNKEMPFIGMDCINSNCLDIHKQYKMRDTKSTAFLFYQGDVLYGRMRSYLNKVFKASFNGAASAEFIVFPKSNYIEPNYLKYLLHQQDFVRFASRNASGDRPRVGFEADLQQYTLKLPPLTEQERIVEKIEELFSDIDDGIKTLEKTKLQIKQYRQSVLKSAFKGALTNTEMADTKVSNLGTVVTGSTPSKSDNSYYGDEIPFFKPTDLNASFYVEFARDNLSQKGFEASRKLPPKSILVTCIGATIGKTGLIRVAGTCNQQINAIIPSEMFVSEYIYFYCISEEFQRIIRHNASATTLPILNKSNFEKLEFKICSNNEQQKIVEEIEKRFEVADVLEQAVDGGLEKAKQLKQSILKKAFEGKLVPQDTSNEPANILLKKIKAEKSKLSSPSKRGKK